LTLVADKITLLFGEMSERCTQAVEEARQGAELDKAEGDAASTLLEGEEHGKWQDTLTQLQELVLDELRQVRLRLT
jgi:hypothetical protein